MNSPEARIRRIVDLHFHPDRGAPYWLDKRPSLGFDPRTDIRTCADLPLLGPLPHEDLAQRPVEDFVPRSLHDRIPECITSETGGTTGAAKRTLFLPEEFEAAFITPFLLAAHRVDFPRDLHWLYIGPTGPHIIGKAARACAMAMGSIDPFSVDFDPRWARTLAEGSMARRRYLEHVLDQAEAILATQHIGVIFSTPPVLGPLSERLPDKTRHEIRGVHLGGLPSTLPFLEHLSTIGFPNACILGGYGNSLAGVCPELNPRIGQLPTYFPHGSRLLLEVDAPPGQTRGTVRFHRLDQSAFLPNVIERDEAEAVPPPPDVSGNGFTAPGLRDPKPAATAPQPAAGSLY